MSTTPEALAPQSSDAPVTPPEAQPDGSELKVGNAADPSPAATDDPSDKSEPEAKWVQKRIDELTKLRHDSERRERDAAKERDHWRDLALRNQPKDEPKAPEPSKPKTLADFGFDEGQHNAYLLAEVSKTATAAARKELEAAQEQKAKQDRLAEYVSRAKTFAKEHSDYKEVAENAPIADHVVEVVVGMDTGPEVAYYLGKNPDIATTISRLPQVNAAIELGRIAARLTYEREAAQKAKSLVSAAPAPSPRIEGTEPGVAVKASSPDSDKMSTADWVKAREKEVRRKR